MKIQSLMTILLLIVVIPASAQECIFFYPHIVGSTLTYQQYDKKNKPSGKLEQKLVSFSTTSTGSKGEVSSVVYDSKDKIVSETNLEMRCDGGIFYFDVMSFVNPESLSAYEDMDVTVDARDVEFPANLKVGDDLKDASVKIMVSIGGFPMTFTVDITGRKVEARESLTTPAGTFEVFKINQTTSVNFGFKLITTSTEWYSQDVGMVKSISYKGGQPYSSSELISLTRQDP